MNLKEKAVKGVAWSAIDKWGRQLISLIILTILARLLNPEEFGLVAMATVFIGFLKMFLDQGFETAIIQRSEIDQEHLHTGFWINIIIGLIFTIVGIALSGLIADFYDEPELAPIVSCLSITLLISSFKNIPEALFKRNMNFKVLSTRTLIARIVGGVVGIILALLGFGVWSLVAQSIVFSLTSVIVLWVGIKWRPKFEYSIPHARDLFGFGVSIMGNRVLNYLNLRLPDLLIGYFLGPTELGYFSLAQNVVIKVLDLVRGVTLSVTVPVFARLQYEHARVRHVFYRVTELTSLIAFPSFIGLFLVSPVLIPALFGPKWEQSIPILQILAVGGLAQSVLGNCGSLIVGLGEPSILFRRQLIIILIRSTLITTVSRLGIVAVSAAYVLSVYIAAPLLLSLVRRLVNITFLKYFYQLKTAFFGSLIMAVIILILKLIVSDRLGLYVQLAIYVFAGGLVYSIVVRTLKPSIFDEIFSYIRLALSKDLRLFSIKKH